MIIENLDDIEMYLEVKLSDLEHKTFYHTASYKGNDDENYTMTLTQMIGELAPHVEQYLADEDFDFASEMPVIPETQWEDWLGEYERPEERCSCSNGCKTCLMTEW